MGERITLGVYPYYPNNPWQELVYGRLRADDVRVVPLDTLEDTAWVETAREDGRAVALHVNWTAPVSQVGSIADAVDRVQHVVAILEQLSTAGVAIIWTVHNVLPHDLRFLLPEVTLCRALAERADLITVLNRDTPRAVRPWYSLPAGNTVELPPPSYVGVYPDRVTRASARERFGIGEADDVLLLLGTLRPYKGIEEAVAAMPELRRRRPGMRLLIAGEVGPGYDEAALRAIVDGVDGVELHVGYIPDSEVQWWMRAADAMLLPYRAGLNSGVLLLAAGFGLPVIMSDSEAAVGVADAPWVHVIPAGHSLDDGVLDGLRAFEAGHPQAAAVAAARANEPARIAALFAAHVRAAVESRGRRVGTLS